MQHRKTITIQKPKEVIWEEHIALHNVLRARTTLHDEAGDLVILEGAPTPPTPPIPAYSPVSLTPKQAFLLVRNIIIKETLALRP